MGNCIATDDPIVYVYLDNRGKYEIKRYKPYKFVHCSDVYKYGEKNLKYDWKSSYIREFQYERNADRKNYNTYVKWKKKHIVSELDDDVIQLTG